MGALLARLEGCLARRRRAAAAGAAGLLAAAGAAIALAVGGPELPAPCAAGAARLAGAWDAARKQAVRAALFAGGAPQAPGIWRTVETHLDRRAASWVAGYTDACEASAVRREQTDQVLTLRMSCLAERREELAQAALLLSEGAVPLPRAVRVAGGVEDASACADIARLTAMSPRPPPGSAPAALVDQVERRLARIEAESDAGFFARAAGQARALLSEAERTGYPPLVARVHARAGNASLRAGDRPAALASFYESLWAAEVGRDEDMAARSWTALVMINGQLEPRPDDEQRLIRHASAAIDRLAARSPRRADALRAELLSNRSALALLRGEAAAAAQLGREGLALGARALGPDAPRLAPWHLNQARALRQLGRAEEAEAQHRRALAIVGVAGGAGECPRTCLPAELRGAPAEDQARSIEETRGEVCPQPHGPGR
jgi:hypothetical protein